MSDLNKETIEQIHVDNYLADKAAEEYDEGQVSIETLDDSVTKAYNLGEELKRLLNKDIDLPW